jgi:hypothetical protein
MSNSQSKTPRERSNTPADRQTIGPLAATP